MRVRVEGEGGDGGVAGKFRKGHRPSHGEAKKVDDDMLGKKKGSP